MHYRLTTWLLGLLVGGTLLAGPPHPDLPDPAFDFETFFVTWSGNGEPWVVPYVKEAKPAIVQFGFFGPMMHAFADSKTATGYPMQLPVAGQREVVENQRQQIEAIRATGAKVVTHIQLCNIIDANETTGESGLFASFLADRWPTDLLGPQPELPATAYLQLDAEGKPLQRKHYHLTYVGLCPANPHARQLLKTMLNVPLDVGVDGITTNYNYYWGCACQWCQTSFRRYLAETYTQAALAELGIEDLTTHTFGEIPARIPGYPKPEETTPLALAAEQWAAITFKEMYDEVLIGHGRSRQPDLILATWNHIGNLGIGEERAFLPIELWGRGENYFWYSGGYGPTKLDEGKLGDGWLNCLYIRELSGGKPFMLGKYEAVRMRNSIAEGLATGGAGMGLYMRMGNEVAYEVGTRYTTFARDNRDLYRQVEPYREVGLLFPRQALMAGEREAMDSFRTVGETLAQQHVLFDIICDEKLSPERLAGLTALVCPQPQRLTTGQREMLAAFTADGGLMLDEWSTAMPALSRIEAPTTVRVAAYRQAERLIVHVVNYDRDEALNPKPRTPADEHPRPVQGIQLDLRLPDGMAVGSVTQHAPEIASAKLEWEEAKGRIQLTVPEFLVYSVIEIGLSNVE